MMRVLVGIFFVFGIALCGGDETSLITTKLAEIKSMAHRRLTATKDVAPLIGRIDKDLAILFEKKKSLIEEKQCLLQRKLFLEASIQDKKNEQNNLFAEQTILDHHWAQYLVQFWSSIAQQSIQPVLQEVAQTDSRATLLAQKFELKQNKYRESLPLIGSVLEDVRG